MHNTQKAKSVLTIILAVFIGIDVLIYFMPFSYSSSKYSDYTFYLYSDYPLLMAFASLLIVITFVLLLAYISNKKYSNIAYGFAAAHIICNLIILLLMYPNEQDSSNYNYGILSGFLFCVITTVIACMLLISLISINCLLIRTDKNVMWNNNTDASNISNKLEELEMLKRRGILTHEEYEKKRSEVIENLKL